MTTSGSAAAIASAMRGVLADVAVHPGHALADARELIQRRLRGSLLEREAGDAGAERLQPQREPRALEARVPGHEHAALAPEARVYVHVRHGAVPELHSCSSWLRSRSVSIACQKPS